MELRERKDEANRLFAKGRYDRAAEAYQELIRREGADPALRLRHAEACRRLGWRAAMVASYQAAAELFRRSGHLARAKAAVRAALAAAPDEPSLRRLSEQLGEAVAAAGKGGLQVLPAGRQPVASQERSLDDEPWFEPTAWSTAEPVAPAPAPATSPEASRSEVTAVFGRAADARPFGPPAGGSEARVAFVPAAREAPATRADEEPLPLVELAPEEATAEPSVLEATPVTEAQWEASRRGQVSDLPTAGDEAAARPRPLPLRQVVSSAPEGEAPAADEPAAAPWVQAISPPGGNPIPPGEAVGKATGPSLPSITPSPLRPVGDDLSLLEAAAEDAAWGHVPTQPFRHPDLVDPFDALVARKEASPDASERQQTMAWPAPSEAQLLTEPGQAAGKEPAQVPTEPVGRLQPKAAAAEEPQPSARSAAPTRRIRLREAAPRPPARSSAPPVDDLALTQPGVPVVAPPASLAQTQPIRTLGARADRRISLQDVPAGPGGVAPRRTTGQHRLFDPEERARPPVTEEPAPGTEAPGRASGQHRPFDPEERARPVAAAEPTASSEAPRRPSGQHLPVASAELAVATASPVGPRRPSGQHRLFTGEIPRIDGLPRADFERSTDGAAAPDGSPAPPLPRALRPAFAPPSPPSPPRG